MDIISLYTEPIQSHRYWTSCDHTIPNQAAYLYKRQIINLSRCVQTYGKKNEIPSEKADKPLIPKLFHFIWLGPKPLPKRFYRMILTWKSLHPDWKFLLWDDTLIQKLPLLNRLAYNQATNYGQRSDILRYEILYRFGGVYVDCDINALQSFDTFHFHNSFIIGQSNTRVWEINNAFIASIPQHPILAEILLRIHFLYQEIDSSNTRARIPVDTILQYCGETQTSFAAQLRSNSIHDEETTPSIAITHPMWTIASTGPGLITTVISQVLQKIDFDLIPQESSTSIIPTTQFLPATDKCINTRMETSKASQMNQINELSLKYFKLFLQCIICFQDIINHNEKVINEETQRIEIFFSHILNWILDVHDSYHCQEESLDNYPQSLKPSSDKDVRNASLVTPSRTNDCCDSTAPSGLNDCCDDEATSSTLRQRNDTASTTRPNPSQCASPVPRKNVNHHNTDSFVSVMKQNTANYLAHCKRHSICHHSSDFYTSQQEFWAKIDLNRFQQFATDILILPSYVLYPIPNHVDVMPPPFSASDSACVAFCEELALATPMTTCRQHLGTACSGFLTQAHVRLCRCLCAAKEKDEVKRLEDTCTISNPNYFPLGIHWWAQTWQIESAQIRSE